uniref:MATH domain-containing protein n=1 Tax=Triticum aestivum TaxID=4565 RepID=A0A3B6A1Q5_WHEAT
MSAAGVVRLSRSATSVVAKAASGFHLLRIDGYSQAKTVLPGEKISSTGFTVGSESWRMDYYPNGRDAAARSNHASVYIQLTDDRTRRPVQARYKFSLLDHAGNTAYELPAETGSFTGMEELEHLIRDDFLVVRCDVGLTEMTCSRLAADEIDNWEDDDEGGEAEEGYFGAPTYYPPHPGRGRRRRQPDDTEYVKWCLAQRPGEPRIRQGR